MKKIFEKIGETFFNGANLIALGAAIFYRGLYTLAIHMLGNIYDKFAWIQRNIPLEEISSNSNDPFLVSDSFISSVTSMCLFGIEMLIILFIVSQLVNYKKKNLSRGSFLIMLIIFTLITFSYCIQLLKISG